MTPAILLTFSNTQDDYLPMIKRERKNIYDTLWRHHNNDLIQVEKEEHTSIQDMFKWFDKYGDRIAVFHYGGHAGDTFLQLENADGQGEKAGAKGIAKLLGSQENLKLVFLNGCATKAQVKLLFAEGVKAVIATSVKINDQMATEFAEQFYHSLASHTTLEKAFNRASSFVATKYQNFQSIEKVRSLDLDEPEHDKAVFPWNLYLNKQATEEQLTDILNWSLPKTTGRRFIYKDILDEYGSQTTANDILIETIIESLAEYNADVAREFDKDEYSEQRLKLAIIDCFPTPIGEQVRKLFTRSRSTDDQENRMDTFTLSRLNQLIHTYKILSQFICYTMLSQLWDEKYKNQNTPKNGASAKKDLKISEDFIVVFNSFFTLTQDNYSSFDFVKLNRAITDIFDGKGIEYFIDEMKQVKIDVESNPELYEAYIFMNSVNEDLLEGRIQKENRQEVTELCKAAEKHLGTVLKSFAFLVKYQLVTIKNIEIIKNKHESPLFRHRKVVLNKAHTYDSFGEAEEVGVEFESFTDNQSVLFLKEENQKLKYLNLTPFIIDKNALTRNRSSMLFFYSHRGKEGHCYIANKNRADLQCFAGRKFKRIQKDFEKFRISIFDSLDAVAP